MTAEAAVMMGNIEIGPNYLSNLLIEKPTFTKYAKRPLPLCAEQC
jgi:hypothetical protein